MSDNLVESYTKLNKKHQETLKENKILKERIQNILEGKEIPAICAKKYEEYEEQVAIRDKALELALSNLYYADKEYYIRTVPSQEEYVEQKTKYWIEQAKESLK